MRGTPTLVPPSSSMTCWSVGISQFLQYQSTRVWGILTEAIALYRTLRRVHRGEHQEESACYVRVQEIWLLWPVCAPTLVLLGAAAHWLLAGRFSLVGWEGRRVCISRKALRVVDQDLLRVTSSLPRHEQLIPNKRRSFTPFWRHYNFFQMPKKVSCGLKVFRNRNFLDPSIRMLLIVLGNIGVDKMPSSRAWQRGTLSDILRAWGVPSHLRSFNNAYISLKEI